MLVAFLAAKQRVEFVPAQVIYKSSASRINPLSTPALVTVVVGAGSKKSAWQNSRAQTSSW